MLYSIHLYFSESQFKDVDELVLECSVSGYPPPDVMWVREGQVILPFATHALGRFVSAVTFDGRCRLFIHNPKESDSGVYTCVGQLIFMIKSYSLDLFLDT